MIQEAQEARQEYLETHKPVKKTADELEQERLNREAAEIKKKILPTKIKVQEEGDFGFCDSGSEQPIPSPEEKDVNDYGEDNEFGDNSEPAEESANDEIEIKGMILQRVNDTKVAR